MTKKIVLTILAFLPFLGCEADKVTPISFGELPAKAQAFVKSYFSSETISVVLCDEELFDKDYEVRFADGSNVEFDKSGEWTSIEMKNGRAVPTQPVPAAMISYVNTKHPGNFIIEVSKEKRKYEVELDNGVDIEFDKDGKFVRYED